MKWKTKTNLGLLIKYNFNKIKIEYVYHEAKNLWDVKVLCSKKSELSEILCKIEKKKVNIAIIFWENVHLIIRSFFNKFSIYFILYKSIIFISLYFQSKSTFKYLPIFGFLIAFLISKNIFIMEASWLHSNIWIIY